MRFRSKALVDTVVVDQDADPPFAMPSHNVIIVMSKLGVKNNRWSF
jgi:hypothetical protein